MLLRQQLPKLTSPPIKACSGSITLSWRMISSNSGAVSSDWQYWVCQMPLLVQKRAQSPLPFEDVQDGRSPRHSVTDRGRGSVLLEEVEVLWPYARAHLGGLQLPARYLEEVIQGLRLHARDLAAVVPATHAHGVGDERAALERL